MRLRASLQTIAMSAQRLHVLARRVELRRRGVGGVGRVRGETRGARASVGGVAARRLDGVAQRRNLADVILDRTPKLRVETRDVFGVKARVVAHCERVRGVATSGLGGVFGDAGGVRRRRRGTREARRPTTRRRRLGVGREPRRHPRRVRRRSARSARSARRSWRSRTCRRRRARRRRRRARRPPRRGSRVGIGSRGRFRRRRLRRRRGGRAARPRGPARPRAPIARSRARRRGRDGGRSGRDGGLCHGRGRLRGLGRGTRATGGTERARPGRDALGRRSGRWALRRQRHRARYHESGRERSRRATRPGVCRESR